MQILLWFFTTCEHTTVNEYTKLNFYLFAPHRRCSPHRHTHKAITNWEENNDNERWEVYQQHTLRSCLNKIIILFCHIFYISCCFFHWLSHLFFMQYDRVSEPLCMVCSVISTYTMLILYFALLLCIVL